MNFCFCGLESHHRQQNYISDVIPKYSNEDFRKHFRMDKKTFECLIDYINLPVQNYCGGNKPVESREMLYITLWYLANHACSLQQISDKFNRSMKCVWFIIQSVITYFQKEGKQFIKWPVQAEMDRVISAFAARSGFPGVIGAIDGCHIRIVAPAAQQVSYLNRKSFHSIILLAVCLPNREFSYIYTGFPGSAHDYRVLKNSGIYLKATQNNLSLFPSQDHHILGDSALPPFTWLVPAFKETEANTPQKRRFKKKTFKNPCCG
jgi:hypothetical protein